MCIRDRVDALGRAEFAGELKAIPTTDDALRRAFFSRWVEDWRAVMADGLAQVWRLPARFVLGTLAGFRLVGEMIADWRMLGLARRARGLGDTGALRRFVTMAFAPLVLAVRRGRKLAGP